MTTAARTDTKTTRVRVRRSIDADPASTALLLAGPTALELWPGVRRVGEVAGRALVEAELRIASSEATRLPAAASVTAGPPRRTPTTFVSRFAWTGPDLPVTSGVLTLTYAPGGHGTPTTGVELVLDAEGLAQSRLDAAGLEAMAEAFLGNLARAAERRSRAA